MSNVRPDDISNGYQLKNFTVITNMRGCVAAVDDHYIGRVIRSAIRQVSSGEGLNTTKILSIEKAIYFPAISRLFAFCLISLAIALKRQLVPNAHHSHLHGPLECLPLHCRSGTTVNHESGCRSPRSMMNNDPKVKIGSMPSTLLVRINIKRLEVVLLRLVSGALISLTRLNRGLILLIR